MKPMYFSSPEEALRSLCREALSMGASDIHIEPQEKMVRIRFRRDGFLEEYGRLPSTMAEGLAVRAKVVGRMNVAENRVPQDGGASFRDGRISCDLRLSLLPSLYGETIVIRLLSPSLPFIEDNHLGMLPVQEAAFRKALRRKSGLILTTGPTGSGKTSTLYAALKLVNQPEVNIISMEDPIEYRIPGITQVAVNEKAGLTFSSGLRALVRQDPDILMIGEIRDRETAEMAVHAALTGHLVLSTLHTVSAVKAPLRLMDMGIPSYLVSASLSLIIAQRLLRLPGGHGRTGVFELFPIVPEGAAHIRENAPEECLIEDMRRQGQPLLAEAIAEKIRLGEAAADSIL